MPANAAVVRLGVAAPLLISVTSLADVRLSAVAKPIDGLESFVSLVVNVYAVFDGTDPATNFLTAVGGLPPEGGFVRVVGGEFFQHAGNPRAGGRLAPPYELLPVVPGLAADTFLTIGAKSDGSPTVPIDLTALSHTFPTEDGYPWPTGVWTLTELSLYDGAWYVVPTFVQGHVGMADNPVDSVLIGQFSVAAGSGEHPRVEGQLYVQGMNDGTVFTSYFGFVIPGPGTLAVVLTAPIIGRRRRRRP